jgi:hypothetical protein
MYIQKSFPVDGAARQIVIFRQGLPNPQAKLTTELGQSNVLYFKENLQKVVQESKIAQKFWYFYAMVKLFLILPQMQKDMNGNHFCRKKICYP